MKFLGELLILIFITVLLLTSSCSMKQLYPLAGSTVGGGIGALGGPGTAAAGAGLGYAAGEMAKGNEELEEAKETIQALTTGDVETLVQKRMEEAKEEGFFDTILDGVYDVMILSLILIAGWNLIPMIYTRYVHKKHNEKSKQ